MGHTPGQWVALLETEVLTDEKRYSIWVKNQDGSKGELAVVDGCHNEAKNAANAILMAAAVDLLMALELVLPMAKTYVAGNPHDERIVEATQAIAKALGTSEPESIEGGLNLEPFKKLVIEGDRLMAGPAKFRCQRCGGMADTLYSWTDRFNGICGTCHQTLARGEVDETQGR